MCWTALRSLCFQYLACCLAQQSMALIWQLLVIFWGMCQMLPETLLVNLQGPMEQRKEGDTKLWLQAPASCAGWAIGAKHRLSGNS